MWTRFTCDIVCDYWEIQKNKLMKWSIHGRKLIKHERCTKQRGRMTMLTSRWRGNRQPFFLRANLSEILLFGCPAVAEISCFSTESRPSAFSPCWRPMFWSSQGGISSTAAGFVLIFSRPCECQLRSCLRGSCGWMITGTLRPRVYRYRALYSDLTFLLIHKMGSFESVSQQVRKKKLLFHLRDDGVASLLRHRRCAGDSSTRSWAVESDLSSTFSIFTFTRNKVCM